MTHTGEQKNLLNGETKDTVRGYSEGLIYRYDQIQIPCPDFAVH
jgi:hypothetical protein